MLPLIIALFTAAPAGMHLANISDTVIVTAPWQPHITPATRGLDSLDSIINADTRAREMQRIGEIKKK